MLKDALADVGGSGQGSSSSYSSSSSSSSSSFSSASAQPGLKKRKLDTECGRPVVTLTKYTLVGFIVEEGSWSGRNWSLLKRDGDCYLHYDTTHAESYRNHDLRALSSGSGASRFNSVAPIWNAPFTVSKNAVDELLKCSGVSRSSRDAARATESGLSVFPIFRTSLMSKR